MNPKPKYFNLKFTFLRTMKANITCGLLCLAFYYKYFKNVDRAGKRYFQELTDTQLANYEIEKEQHLEYLKNPMIYNYPNFKYT